jgi:hypothetical protein
MSPRFQLVRFIVLAIIVFVACETVQARKIFSVKAGAFSTHAEAMTLRDELGATCSPVFVENWGNPQAPYVVLIGHFEYAIEANEVRKQLRRTIAPNARMFNWTYDDRTLMSNTVPIQRPFLTDGLSSDTTSAASRQHYIGLGIMNANPPASEVAVKLVTAMNNSELLSVGMGGQDNDKAIQALERFITNNPTAAEVNCAKLRKVRRLVGPNDYAKCHPLLDDVVANGTAAEKEVAHLLRGYALRHESSKAAYEHFATVASLTTASASLRREAMRRAAGNAHVAGLLSESYQCFDQIEREAANVDELTEARMQKGGLAFEILLEENVGDWDNVRRLLASVWAIPNAPEKYVVTAKLMHAETHFKEENYHQSLLEMDALINEYGSNPAYRRDISMAMTWRGIALHKVGDNAGAQRAFDDVLGVGLAREENFKDRNIDALAAYWQTYLSHLNREYEESETWQEYLERVHPDSRETLKARSQYGEIE